MAEKAMLCIDIILQGVMSKPFLYDKFHLDCQDPHIRRKAFTDIAVQVNNYNYRMNNNCEPCTGNDVRSMWNTLLNDYKEARKEMWNDKSGDGLKAHDYPYKQEMSFMQRHVLSSLNLNNGMYSSFYSSSKYI
uniref:MADF domain-containing protein n=1 Tax=Trichogramma kaykai TaxID=54128 RepID=A0ABD2WZK2_9HYME